MNDMHDVALDLWAEEPENPLAASCTGSTVATLPATLSTYGCAGEC
ncbi:hypothetical protein AB5J62_12850 [Amycolatopsis sp. cg5]